MHHPSFAFCRGLCRRPDSRVLRSRNGTGRGRYPSIRWTMPGRLWGNGNQRRRQTWAIIGRYVLLLITIMTAKPGRGYRVRSHGWSACRVYKRCIHLIGIHAASKFLASTCYLGLSLFLSFSPFLPLFVLFNFSLSFRPCIYLSLFRSHRSISSHPCCLQFFIVAGCSFGLLLRFVDLLLCTCVRT